MRRTTCRKAFSPGSIRRWVIAFVAVMPLLPSAAGAVTQSCDPVEDSGRIAAAGGSITEIIYLLGEQERLVAVDTTSVFPPEAMQRFPSLGYVRNLSAEGLVAMSPTLILGEEDMGPDEVLTQLGRLGVTSVRLAEDPSAAGIIEKVRCVAGIIGKAPLAQAKIDADLQSKLTALDALPTPDRPARVALLLGIRDGVPLAAGSGTSGDGLLRMVRAQNVFADVSGWKPVSMESMAAMQPDIIVVPNRGANAEGGVEGFAAHPAIRLTPAAQRGRIIAMDGMAILGFGPRTLDAALTLSRRIDGALNAASDGD
ncbi:MAG: ABC transporter substrate-binding protein [Pseudomonadota bacterium]